MNLSGFSRPSETMFPGIRLLPDPRELEEGDDRAASGRVVRLSGYGTRVFDMHSARDRKAYGELMMDLSERMQRGRLRVLANDRQVMTRKDGTTGWFRYVEWMEFDWQGEAASCGKEG